MNQIAKFAPIVVGLVMSTAVGTIAEDLAKKALPASVSTVGSYAVRLGAAFAGAVAGGIVSHYVTKNLTEIIETVQNLGEEAETPALEEN